MEVAMRKHPNIVISGNPGVGKTSLAKKLAITDSSMRYIDFGKEAVEQGCHDGWDDELDCHIVDYEEMANQLNDKELRQGGCIIDWIHADFWPNDGLIDLVVTVTCNNTVLYDRYAARGYSQKKINENLDSEIMEEIVEENQSWFAEDPDDEPNSTTLVRFKSESDQDMARNLKALETWVEKWRARRSSNSNTDGNANADANASGDTKSKRVSMDDS